MNGFIAKLTEKLEIQVAIKAGITASLSFFLGVAFSKLFNRPDSLVSGLWCILTSIVVLQPHIGGTYRAAWMRFLGILIGSILGAAFTVWFGSSPLQLGISVACTVAICSLLNLSDSFRIAAMSVAVVMVLWGAHSDISPWIFATFRFLDSCLGILIAVVVTHAIWPAKTISAIQDNSIKCLHMLTKLYVQSSNVEAHKDHLEVSSLSDIQDIQDLIDENRKILNDTKIEQMLKRDGWDNWKQLMTICERLFDEIYILRTINKHILSMMIDDQLAGQLENLIVQTELTLKQLTSQLEKNTWAEPLHTVHLQESVKSLKEDLIRFRSTKVTRKYELQDVEGFFVYFYTIVVIADQIMTIQEQVGKALTYNSQPFTL